MFTQKASADKNAIDVFPFWMTPYLKGNWEDLCFCSNPKYVPNVNDGEDTVARGVSASLRVHL